MKAYALLPIALLALIANRPHPTAHDLTDAERERVESEVADFLASYLEVIEGDDSEAVRGLFVGDERFAWFTDGEKRYTSADEVIASLASMAAMTFSTETLDVEILPLTPSLAHARTAFHTELSQDGAVVYEFGGVITWLLEDVPDDGWRVLTGHTSTPKER